ncbi:MAG: hypoxanthine-guanine phosphoribosyltransferase [Lysobacterales bacterium]
MSKLDYQTALERADLLHDRPALEAALDRMAAEISERLKGQRPIYVTVLTGGLITAGMLAPRVDVDLDFDYVHVTRYHGETKGGELHWKARPRYDFAGRPVIFVDDILDEGHTLDALKKHALAAGATAVYIAVLVKKEHDRCVPGVVADFVGLTVPDRYVFGFGMDFEEHGRSLFGIYAI